MKKMILATMLVNTIVIHHVTYGADTRTRNKKALDEALNHNIVKDNTPHIQALLESGATIEDPEILFCDLILLCKNRTKTIALLVKHGANINYRKARFGYTPLHVAARRLWLNTIEALLHNGADANILDQCGATPLSLALVEFGVPYEHHNSAHARKIFELLIRHTDVTKGTYDRLSPIQYCRKYNKQKTLALMEQKPEVPRKKMSKEKST